MTEYLIPLSLLFVCSGLISYVSTAIVKHAAEHIGLVDRPNARKLHQTATPRLGGLAIIFGFGFPLLILAGNERAVALVSKNLPYLFAVLASGSLIVGLGVYDDLIGTNAPKKFIVQFAAAFILVSYGFRFDFISIAGTVVNFGVLGVVLSVIWIVGVINAMNFIDGMDSLATVIALTIAIAFGAIAVIRYDAFSLVIMVSLTGSLLGFLPWNRPPARIFMGDSGSLFIGLLLAAISIARPSKSPAALLFSGPILALALPVLDTLIVMQQRFGGQQVSLTARFARVFTADRNHIHHILVEKYGSPAKAIFWIWAVTLLFAGAAVLTAMQETKNFGYTSGALALLLMLMLRYWKRGPKTPAVGASEA